MNRKQVGRACPQRADPDVFQARRAARRDGLALPATGSWAFSWKIFLALCAAVVLICGCSREAAPPKPLAIDQAPASLQEVFKGASPESKKLVDDAVAALGGKDFAKALFALQSLSGRSDLTASQRDIASRSMLAVNQALADQASSGDQSAQQVLQFQRSNK